MSAASVSSANPTIDVTLPAIPLPNPSFENSRRLTGPNRHFADCGAVLETLLDSSLDDGTIARWRIEIEHARIALGWPPVLTDARRIPQGAVLALSAPIDQLYTATEINEWAWQRAAQRNDGWQAPGHAAVGDQDSALHTLQCLAVSEQQPRLLALQAAAQARQLPSYVDEDTWSVGEGTGSFCAAMSCLPSPLELPWSALHAVPKILVTGSNGKTTSVRLLAALLAARGDVVGHTCTDGLFVAGREVEPGDFSGPAGARAILRRPEVQAAVLEAARGGLLRRGLGVSHADVALVTNVSAEHFGEYGIHDLDGLAEVKLVLERAIDPHGCLVLNADDATLRRKSTALNCRLAWFALDDQHPVLQAERARGGSTCAVAEGRLLLSAADQVHDLGRIDALPLSFGGYADYNIANLAGAALTAFQFGLAPTLIAQVLADFGSRRSDNPGRLQIWQLGALRVLVDYAHNPEGLTGFLNIARHGQRGGRLGLLLGQAGNRDDADVRALADVAADQHPDRIVLKDIDGYLRGRQSGEVAGVLHAQLLRRGIPPQSIDIELDETAAAIRLLAWARADDVIALPLHGSAARIAIGALLDQLEASAWQAGQTVPVLATCAT